MADKIMSSENLQIFVGVNTEQNSQLMEQLIDFEYVTKKTKRQFGLEIKKRMKTLFKKKLSKKAFIAQKGIDCDDEEQIEAECVCHGLEFKGDEDEELQNHLQQYQKTLFQHKDQLQYQLKTCLTIINQNKLLPNCAHCGLKMRKLLKYLKHAKPEVKYTVIDFNLLMIKHIVDDHSLD